MTPHLCFLLWVILSQCSTGDTKRDESSNKKLGQKCAKTCDGGINLICNTTTKLCQCNSDFTIVVQTNIKTLCLQSAKLSDECLHDDACLATDQFSECDQTDSLVARCKCQADYHEIFDKNTQSNRCVPEAQLLSSDLATLLGVGAGMTLFCGLTCLVLRIFARARFGPRHHHYANAGQAPGITLSTDHDGERGGTSRHSSQRSSTGGSRRPSMLAPPSTRPGEDGSRRASNSSIRSTGSSRSYSLKHHSNHQHYHHHRPSDPETHLGLNLTNLSISHPNSDTNISPSSQSINSQQLNPNKDKRSGSAGAI